MLMILHNRSKSYKKGGLLYSTKNLVEFGNYILSRARKEKVSKESRDQVGHWDLANYIESGKTGNVKDKLKEAAE
jgi:hypothetical protein